MTAIALAAATWGLVGSSTAQAQQGEWGWGLSAPPESSTLARFAPQDRSGHADRWMASLLEREGEPGPSRIGAGLHGTLAVGWGTAAVALGHRDPALALTLGGTALLEATSAVGLLTAVDPERRAAWWLQSWVTPIGAVGFGMLGLAVDRRDGWVALAGAGSLAVWAGFLASRLLFPVPSAAGVAAEYEALPRHRRDAFLSAFLERRNEAQRRRAAVLSVAYFVAGAMSLTGAAFMETGESTGPDTARLMGTMLGGMSLLGGALGLVQAVFGPLVDEAAIYDAGEPPPELP